MCVWTSMTGLMRRSAVGDGVLQDADLVDLHFHLVARLHHIGGLRRAPTPPGVPVTSTSPGSSVVHAETYSMIFGILKIICSVLACCMRSPFRRQESVMRVLG